MNWLKRATLNLTMRYVRTFILIVIFSVIAALLFSGISIMDASGRLEDQAKATVGSEVTISVNMTNAPGNGLFNPILMTEKQLASLTGQPHVKDYNAINISYKGVSDGFSVTGDRNRTLLIQQRERYYFSTHEPENLAKTYLEPDLTIYGVRKSELSDQFVSGGYKLVSGRVLTEKDFNKNVALITKPVADKNGLEIGDTIHLNIPEKRTHYPFTVVGIFTTPAPASSTLADASELTPYNDVFVPYTQLGLFNKPYLPLSLNNSVYTVNFYLDDPANVAGFANYAKKLLGDNYIEQSNDDLYEAAVMPLKSVDTASRLLAALTLVAGGIIFALIVVFSLRGRQREFGVLLAVGEKRKKILSQIFVEVLVPVIIAFGVGVAAGGGICGIIGNGMLSQKAASVQAQQNQKLISEKYTDTTMTDGYVGKAVSASPIDKIDMSISARDLGLLAAACLILTAVSSAAPCISMMRYKPRQILQQK